MVGRQWEKWLNLLSFLCSVIHSPWVENTSPAFIEGVWYVYKWMSPSFPWGSWKRTAGSVVLSLHPDALTLLLLFSPVLLWLQVSFHRVSAAPGAQLAPSLEAPFLPRAPQWACLGPKALFLSVLDQGVTEYRAPNVFASVSALAYLISESFINASLWLAESSSGISFCIMPVDRGP